MIGPWVKIFDADGDVVYVVADDEPQIDAAVTAYLESGGLRNSVLCLTRLDGDVYKMLASHCVAWLISTPEGRRKDYEVQKEIIDENTANKHAAGMWDAE